LNLRRTVPAFVACAALAITADASALNPEWPIHSAKLEHFGKMFPNLPVFQFSDQATADLAASMTNPKPDPPGTDQGTHDDSPTLPSEYTYLGQILDHNLDFDNTPQPTAPVNPDKLVNSESFRWDLNDVFGGGPTADPQVYAADHKHLLIQGTPWTPKSDGRTVVSGGNPNGVLDLPRNADGTANIIEPRNDENQIISQTDASFITFYNDFVDWGDTYAQARALTENYYQEMILKDILPEFVGQATIDKYLKHVTIRGHTVYRVITPNFPNANFTPIEFSVGAYRFGHPLVRQQYHINDILPDTTDLDDNIPIFDLNVFQTGDLTGGNQLPGPHPSSTACQGPDQSTMLCTAADNPAGHQIEWKYFVPAINKKQLADGNPDPNVASPNGDTGINFARNTQATISPALLDLPAFTIPGCADVADPVCNGSGNVIIRDFARGRYDGLASGQAIAKAMRCPVIPAKRINPTKDAVFNSGTPLLYYVLKEAKKAHKTLGCVGAGIVAQTFLQVLWATSDSILHNGFKPNPKLVPVESNKATFSFADLLVDTKIAPSSS
jgi:hypothetical protein